MAPSVKLHFFAANDVNGDLLHEITDEDDYFKSLKLKVERDGLGGAELLLARTVGFSPFADGTFRAESFVRLIIPAYSSTTYYPWGFFLNKRQQVVVHADEKGGEEFKLGGPGPKQYLARHALGIGTQTSQAPTVDLENGVWRWNEHATVGRILNKILDEDAALNNPSLPDLTWTFDNIDDSDSVNWIDDDIAGPGEFEVPIGTDFLKVLWDLDDFVQLTSWVDLGTVATPKFELNIIQGLGDDNTGSAFGAGVCLLKEGVNVADDAVTVEGASLRQASHVLVEGKDGVWVQAVRTGYSPGDYTKREKISFTRTSNEAWLEAVGKRWLDRQDNGEKEITIEIVPGQSDSTGLYFPAPNRVLWLSNLISVETAADGTSQTALDLDPSDAQLVTGFELDTHQAADDSDSTALARSWDVKVKLNVERSGNVQKTPDQRSTASSSGCNCHGPGRPLIQTNLSWRVFEHASQASGEINPEPADWKEPGYDDSVAPWVDPIIFAHANQDTVKIAHPDHQDALRRHEFFLRKEFHVEADQLTGLDADYWLYVDDGVQVFVNGVSVITVGTPFTAAGGIYTGTIARSNFVEGLNCIGIYLWNQGAGSDGGNPPGGSVAGFKVNVLAGVDSDDPEHVHHASEIPIADLAGNYDSDNVEGALAEAAAGGGGGAPTNADYLVGTANGSLSAEIVVGTTPGGELGGTWASPTVDATHSGSAHHAESHQSRHNEAGADELKLDDLGIPDDNTDLDATTSRHGLLPKLGGGTDNFLRADGSWQEPPGTGAATPNFAGVKVYHSTTQTALNNTDTRLAMDSEVFDTNAYHDTATNNSRITIPSGKGGYYVFGCQVTWDSNGTGSRTVRIKKNNGATLLRGVSSIRPAGASQIMEVHGIEFLSVGDYLEISVFQSSGGTRTLGDAATTENQNSFWAYLIGL